MDAPQQAVLDAQAGAARAGYPDLWPLLVAIAANESGYDPGAIGDQGHSRGYLQFYDQGLGAGHDPAELLDGVSNMALGAKYIGDRLAQGASVEDATQPWSTRTADLALWRRWQAEGLPAGTAAVDAAPAVGGSALVPFLAVAAAALVLLR